MNIVVIGAGYVGLVTGTCLSDIGHNVTIVDIDDEKIAALRHGHVPIYEPGLAELLLKNAENEKLRFDTEIPNLSGIDFVFIAVGTPSDQNHAVDCCFVYQAAADIAPKLQGHTTVVIKSTVPPGTAKKVKQILKAGSSPHTASFSVVSNPEFLKEGDAIRDFQKPDRIVVGVDAASKQDTDAIYKLYKPILRNVGRFLVMSNESAELSKYATNGMLASRVSYMNEISRISEAVNADIDDVRSVVGSDSRIGSKFLFAGPGWGGSCWPKDILGLVSLAESRNVETPLLQGTLVTNHKQKESIQKKIDCASPSKIAIWGLAFKPGTDDTRESPTHDLLSYLWREYKNTEVSVYDPKAVIVHGRVKQVEDMYLAAKDADCLILMTDWPEFKQPNWSVLKNTMKPRALVIDARNLWDPEDARARGFRYKGVGR